MPSQHLHPTHAFRPAPGEWNPAEEILTARSVKPGAFLRACLRWLASDPDAAFEALAGHWPEDRPRGRPRGKRRQRDADAGSG